MRNHVSRPRSITEIVHEGQPILVQVTKEPLGTKGARVVTNLSIPGRYLVLMPTVDYIGISRRIQDEAERERFREIAKRICPAGFGLIVRTVAEGRSEEELMQDAEFLTRMWKDIEARARDAKPPALVYKDYDLVYRLTRDRFTNEIHKFVIDSEPLYRKVIHLLDFLAPHLKDRVYRYHEGPPIFDAYGIEKQIDQALELHVWLNCGGYLVIDHSEALTSIDVNTGRYIGTTNLSDTVLKTNLEAAEEITVSSGCVTSAALSSSILSTWTPKKTR